MRKKIGPSSTRRQASAKPSSTGSGGNVIAERIHRRRGIGKGAAEGSATRGAAAARGDRRVVGQRVTDDATERQIANERLSVPRPSVLSIANSYAVHRDVVKRVWAAADAAETAPSMPLDPASRGTSGNGDGNISNGNGNDGRASGDGNLRAHVAGAALRAVPIKMRLRVLKRAVNDPDLRVALAALRELNEMNDIGGKNRDIAPIDTRPLFALPSRESANAGESSQVTLPVDIAIKR